MVILFREVLFYTYQLLRDLFRENSGVLWSFFLQLCSILFVDKGNELVDQSNIFCLIGKPRQGVG